MTKRRKRIRFGSPRKEQRDEVLEGRPAAPDPALAPTVEAKHAYIEAAIAETKEHGQPRFDHKLPPIDHDQLDAELDEMMTEMEMAAGRTTRSPDFLLPPEMEGERDEPLVYEEDAPTGPPWPDDEPELLPYYEEEITGPLPAFLPIDAAEDDAHLAQIVRESDVEAALGAIATLERRGVASATEALLDAVGHADLRVVRAALSALAPRSLVVDVRLVAALTKDNVVRAKLLRIMERQAAGAGASTALRALLFGKESASWSGSHRVCAARLLLRWGDRDALAELVAALVAKNEARSSYVEAWRQEVFEAVQRVGGERAAYVLSAALTTKSLPEHLRAALTAALDQL